MRTAIVCAVAAGVIAAPGLIVAATSSSSPARYSVVTGSSRASGSAAPGRTGYAPSARIVLGPPPVDPALRPAVRAVKRAYSARGVRLVVAPVGPGVAEAVDPTTPRRCPTVIQFRKADSSEPSDPYSSCAWAALRLSAVTIVYSPPSAGPTIRAAVANLR
jgi:hypothetical protein